MTARMMQPAYDIEEWRSHIPLLRTIIPMNNCSQAPQSEATRRAAEEYLRSWNDSGMDWDRWMEEIHLAKAEFGRLINASPEEIAVASSVSEATAGLASALDYSGSRRRIAVTEAEFPTVGHVWLAHEKYGAQVDWVPLRDEIVHLEDYDSVVGPDTLLVSACHGYYQNGFKQNLAKVVERAHADGALAYIDAYQTLGTHPIDVKALDIDFLATGNLKYLMGVPGIAFLYVKPKHLDRLHPAVTGWFGRKNPFAFDVKSLDWAPGAARFDTGTPPVMNAYIARAGMAMLNEIGIEAIYDWTTYLSQALIEGGRKRGFRLHGIDDPEQKAPSTAFVCPGDAHEVEERMRAKGILPSARGDVIRLAPHFYSTLEDVQESLDTLARVFEEMEEES